MRNPRPNALVGRPFFNIATEYLLVGGGLSLLCTAFLKWGPYHPQTYTGLALATVLLVSNSAHFASSTVRLYTKPGAFQTWPFLTMVFPLVSLVVLGLCVAAPKGIGTHLQSLYLTWSPYHYAAQAYGLAVLYSYRSGCALAPADKRWLRAVCMLPFVYAFISAPGAGLFWFLSKAQVQAVPVAGSALHALGMVLPWVGFLAPFALYFKIWHSKSGPMPLIALLAILANGVWWFTLTAMGAFFWATVFHGLQYLVIVMVFHVRDHMQQPDNTRTATAHVLRFYGLCLLLGYGLFHTLPWAFGWAGFGRVESMLLVIAAINLHHFVVDGFIWKLRPGDSNRRVVEAGVNVGAAPALAGTAHQGAA